MKNPFTGKEMKLIREKAKLPYRKDEFTIVYHAYECEDTNERFTNDELDMINIIQVHNLYREKYGIPFPEEIKNIREKYEVSAKKMSEILGLGQNAYRLYESGEIPSVSIGRLIASIKDAEEFRKQIEFSSHLLKPSEYEKLMKSVDLLIHRERDSQQEFLSKEYTISSIDDYSGFKLLDINKIANVLSFFHSKGLKLFKTKTNKLLFYADFLNFKRSGNSMMGITFKAIPFGPVPDEFERLFQHLYDDGLIEINRSVNGDNLIEIFTPEILFNADLFSENELAVLNEIVNKFKDKNTTEVVDISHEEPAWIDNNEAKRYISYKKYAFDLKAFE